MDGFKSVLKFAYPSFSKGPILWRRILKPGIRSLNYFLNLKFQAGNTKIELFNEVLYTIYRIICYVKKQRALLSSPASRSRKLLIKRNVFKFYNRPENWI